MAAMAARPSITGRASLPWWGLFLGIGGVVVVLDQATKAWVTSTHPPASPFAPPGSPEAPVPVLGDLVRIAVTHNDGGIFGLFGASATLLGLASLGVIAIIVVLEARQGIGSPLLTVALGLLLGGAIGNVIDRLRMGYVVDWVDMGLGRTRWYTFNVADAAISTSIVLLLALGLLGPRLGRLAGSAAQAGPVDDQPAAASGVQAETPPASSPGGAGSATSRGSR
jgi:signal peptidase II